MNKDEHIYYKYVFKSILAKNTFNIKEVHDVQSLKYLYFIKDEYAKIETLIRDNNIEAIKSLPDNHSREREYLDIMMFMDQNTNKYIVTVYDRDELMQDPEVIEIYPITRDSDDKAKSYPASQSKNEGMIEIGLNDSYIRLFKRVFKLFKYHAIALIIGMLLFSMTEGFQPSLILCFLSCILLSFFYCIFISWQTLYKVIFRESSGAVEVQYIKGNSVIKKEFDSRSHLKVLIRKNFSFRHPLWKIYIYYKGNLILSQNELNGWSNEMFLEIERNISSK